MKIHITDEALQYFKNEMEAQSGDTIRFFAKYGGSTDLTQGFSVGVHMEEVERVAVEEVVDGIHFVVSDQDDWLFQGQDVKVSIENEEIVFSQAKE
ncbi:MAG: adhesin [Exiguobacterium sp.]